MKKHLILTVSLLVLCCMSCSNDDESQPSPTTLEGTLDQFFEQRQADNRPGISIAIRKKGEVVYQGNKGTARFDTEQSINSETQFRVGSISKPITAIAIMQLVEDGVISLEDRLLSYYPELPASFENITVRHLLSHRSGMLDYIDDNTDITALDNLVTSDVLDFIEPSGLGNLNFEPGTMGRYSNTGYVFLALIVEKVTNKSFPEYLKTAIFEVAGMTNSFVIYENEHLGDNGENYALSFGTNIKVKGFNSLIYGASGVVSTTTDMMKFVEALLSHELVSKETLDLMTVTAGSVPDIETDYGLGWLTGTGNYWHTGLITDPNDYWHSGGFDGYQTVLSINPDLDLQIIVLSNGGNDTKEKMWDLVELTRNHFKQ